MLAVNETSLTLQVEYYRQDDLQLPLDAVIVSFCREQCQDRRPMVRAIILNIQSVMISLHLISVETGVISIRKSRRFLGFCLRSLHKNHCLVGALHQIVHSQALHITITIWNKISGGSHFLRMRNLRMIFAPSIKTPQANLTKTIHLHINTCYTCM